MELNALIAECTAYDYKVMLEEKKPKSWLKSVSAFANGLGGSLFFGIDNDGIVKGLDDVQHVCESISSKIRDYMDPLPEVEMIPHDIDGLHILQLKVNAGHYTPYYYFEIRGRFPDHSEMTEEPSPDLLYTLFLLLLDFRK